MATNKLQILTLGKDRSMTVKVPENVMVEWDELTKFFVGFGYAECVREHIDEEADVNAKNDVGLTALHCAAWSGNADCVRMLLEAGADVSAKDWRGETPLHTAVMRDHAEVIALLQEHTLQAEVTEAGGGSGNKGRNARERPNEKRPFGAVFSVVTDSQSSSSSSS